MFVSPSQSKYSKQRDSMTDGTGSGGPERLSHLRAMTESGLGKNKVTGVLPESATKFSAHGAIYAKDGTKAEGFDGDNEDRYMTGLTEIESDTERDHTQDDDDEDEEEEEEEAL
jgi:hypothetical protein